MLGEDCRAGTRRSSSVLMALATPVNRARRSESRFHQNGNFVTSCMVMRCSGFETSISAIICCASGLRLSAPRSNFPCTVQELSKQQKFLKRRRHFGYHTVMCVVLVGCVVYNRCLVHILFTTLLYALPNWLCMHKPKDVLTMLQVACDSHMIM